MRRRKKAPRFADRSYAGDGIYFITLCTQNRERLFGEIRGGRMHPNAEGQIVDKIWLEIPARYPHCRLDAHVVMPDHFHGILVFEIPKISVLVPQYPSVRSIRGGTGGSRPARDPADGTIGNECEMMPEAAVKDLSSIVGAFKTVTAKQINLLKGTPGIPVWQRGFHDRPIWNERVLPVVRRYIDLNPVRWKG